MNTCKELTVSNRELAKLILNKVNDSTIRRIFKINKSKFLLLEVNGQDKLVDYIENKLEQMAKEEIERKIVGNFKLL